MLNRFMLYAAGVLFFLTVWIIVSLTLLLCTDTFTPQSPTQWKIYIVLTPLIVLYPLQLYKAFELNKATFLIWAAMELYLLSTYGFHLHGLISIAVWYLFIWPLRMYIEESRKADNAISVGSGETSSQSDF